jgi:hypothetical protein
LENEEQIDKYLDAYHSPKLNQEDTKNLRPIISNESETIIRNLPSQKCPSPNGYTAEFYQLFKRVLATMLLKLFHKI